MGERPGIVIEGLSFEWDPENGVILIIGQPVVCTWIETTMAGLMSGIHRMVGTERLVLAAEQAGRQSAEGEWGVVGGHATIEDGLRWGGRAQGVGGLGNYELVSMDHAKKEARFLAHHCWESLYQRALGVSWGSSMTGGRLSLFCTKAFGTYCRAEQTAFIARGDPCDEFVVRPSERTVEQDLEALLRAEKATQANLVAALERLRREVGGRIEERRDRASGAPAPRATGEMPRLSVVGVELVWDLENGIMTADGLPVVCMWIEAVMAPLMGALAKTVGPERFSLAMEQAGRESIEGEWQNVIFQLPTIEGGINEIGRRSAAVGLGRFELVSLDRNAREARFRSYNGWEGIYQRALGVSWGSSAMAGRFGAYGTKLLGTYCRAEQTAFMARGDAHDEFVVRPSALRVEQELESLIGVEAAVRDEIAMAFDRLRRALDERGRMEQDLRREVEERRRIEEELLRKLELIRQQEAAIRTMSTPIIRLWEGILTMPVMGLVDSERAARMMESLLEEITRTQTRFTILDLTGVEVMDKGAASNILQLVQAARLLGTRCLVSGISPGMASAVVELGLDLGDLQTFGTLEAALRFALKEAEREGIGKTLGRARGVGRS